MLCWKGSSTDESPGVNNPGRPVCVCKVKSYIKEGYALLVTGKLMPQGDRLMVDLIAPGIGKDIALRAVVSASTNTLVCNSYVRFQWDSEERITSAKSRLAPGKEFELQAFFAEKFIFIALDGVHLIKYKSGIPNNLITTVEISGDVTDVNPEHKYIQEYPLRRKKTSHITCLSTRYAQTADAKDIDMELESAEEGARAEQFLPLPYYATFSKGFLALGYSIIINGQVGANPVLIRVSLQESECVWPQPNVAMQLEFHFTENFSGSICEPVITLDYFANGKWAGKVVSPLISELLPGSEFNLAILRGRSAYEISLNNKHVYKYPFRRSPKVLKTCLIEGEIKLYDVLIESD